MSVYKNRMIRFMYKDINLPLWCYTPTKAQFYALFGECKCIGGCKFTHEPQQKKDYRNSSLAKDPQ
jgi:hypothetical protein